MHENVGRYRFPNQGPLLGHRVAVRLPPVEDDALMGTVMRQDVEPPKVVMIRLDDGRVVLGAECVYRPLAGEEVVRLSTLRYAIEMDVVGQEPSPPMKAALRDMLLGWVANVGQGSAARITGVEYLEVPFSFPEDSPDPSTVVPAIERPPVDLSGISRHQTMTLTEVHEVRRDLDDGDGPDAEDYLPPPFTSPDEVLEALEAPVMADPPEDPEELT